MYVLLKLLRDTTVINNSGQVEELPEGKYLSVNLSKLPYEARDSSGVVFKLDRHVIEFHTGSDTPLIRPVYSGILKIENRIVGYGRLDRLKKTNDIPNLWLDLLGGKPNTVKVTVLPNGTVSNDGTLSDEDKDIILKDCKVV